MHFAECGIQEFKGEYLLMCKKDRFIICVDSDGCAIDTMTIKHELCFGPCFIEVWNLTRWREQLQKRWNEINLYSLTRGINRFKGLIIILKEIDSNLCHIEDLEDLLSWAETTKAFSEDELKKEILKKPESVSLNKALLWSQKVNEKIDSLSPSEKKAFDGVKETLEKAEKLVDIAIVSSANEDAVTLEWSHCGLLSKVTHLFSQNAGTKEMCLLKLKDMGYDGAKMLMIGDAPGDLAAANSAGIDFYPIITGRESESWKEFTDKILDAFINGVYHKNYYDMYLDKFKNNLSGN